VSEVVARAIVEETSKLAKGTVVITVPPTYGSARGLVEYLKITPSAKEDMPVNPAAVNVKFASAQTGYALELKAGIVGQLNIVIDRVAEAEEQPPVPATV
jgi:hypothetical protein